MGGQIETHLQRCIVRKTIFIFQKKKATEWNGESAAFKFFFSFLFSFFSGILPAEFQGVLQLCCATHSIYRTSQKKNSNWNFYTAGQQAGIKVIVRMVVNIGYLAETVCNMIEEIPSLSQKKNSNNAKKCKNATDLALLLTWPVLSLSSQN